MIKINKYRADIEDKILQLISLAEVNLECCNVIYEFLCKQKGNQSGIGFFNQNYVKYLLLSARNHFSESVSIIHSLLHKPKETKELSFNLYEKEVINKYRFEDKSKTQDFLSEIKYIRKEYKKRINKNKKFPALPAIRNKLVAHKDFENIGDPLKLPLTWISNKILEKLQKIIKNMQEVALRFFKEKISYYLFIDDNKEGLKEILNSYYE